MAQHGFKWPEKYSDMNGWMKESIIEHFGIPRKFLGEKNFKLSREIINRIKVVIRNKGEYND